MVTDGRVLSVVKWVLLVLAVVFLVWISAGGKVSSTELSVVADAVTEAAQLTDTLEGDNHMILRLYGLDPGDYDGAVLRYPSTNMVSQEMLLIRLRDTSQQETVRAAMEKRVAAQMDSFEGYAVAQYEMLEKSIVEIQGNYALLIVSDDPDTVRKAFLDAL